MEKLTINKIKEDNKKYEKTTRFNFELGDKDMYVDVYQDFSPKKIKNLIQDYLTDLEVISTELEGEELGTLGGKDFLCFYMILHFTKMFTEKQKASFDVADKLEVFDALLTSGAFELIVSHFPIDSVGELNDALVPFMDEYISMREEQLKHTVQSQEVSGLDELVAPLLALSEKMKEKPPVDNVVLIKK